MIKIALVGASGMVGRKMLQVLEERQFPVEQLIPVASERSVGQKISFRGTSVEIQSMTDALEKKPAIALFSAGGDTALEWAPQFAAQGCYVIDNSSAFRMQPDKKLIVPEINGHLLEAGDYIIPNPNCSTIQLVMVLGPLQSHFGLERVVISTYQSITGTGMKAVQQLQEEMAGLPANRVYPHPIHQNCLPHCDVFLENGYTKEEMKLMMEPRKILGLPELALTATAVRVPVMGGHSESVNITLKTDTSVDALRAVIAQAPGVVLVDDPAKNQYPMPLTAHDRDEVFVGRIRKDPSFPKSFNMWIVADNLRKGAATNAVQIAELLLEKGLV
jgi:aspartate-semialdehyde dehydrogenase